MLELSGFGTSALNGGFHGGFPIAGWFILENPTKMDENWGFTHFGKPPNWNEMEEYKTNTATLAQSFSESKLADRNSIVLKVFGQK